MSDERRAIRRCDICGVRLRGQFYWTGRCAKHQTTRDPELRLISDMAAAKARGLSYGQYMALKNKED